MREPPPPPVTPPANLVANRLVFTVAAAADDTDRNGYVDSLLAAAYLFSQPYPIPLSIRGAFEIRLTDPRGTPLRTWQIDAEKTAAAMRVREAGPYYEFRLSLLDDPAGDKLKGNVGQVLCTFIPADPQSPPVRSSGGATVQIGRLK
jgi:hypothetical protein